MTVLWYDGEVQAEDVLPISPTSNIWRGQGWFETMAVEGGEVLNLDAHLARLESTLPRSPGDRLDRFREDANKFADQFGTEPGVLKLVTWLDDDGIHLGGWIKPYDPPSQKDYENGVGLEIVNSSHPPRWPLSDEKRTSYAGVMERRQNSSRWGVLYCDPEGYVWECGIANVIWYDGERIVTPPVNENVLPGTVLSAIKERGEGLDLPLVEERFRFHEPSAGLWVTNSVIGLLPVNRVGDRELDVDPDDPVRRTLRPTLGSDKVIPLWHS